MEPHKPVLYLSRAQLAERIGLSSDSLSRYKLPTPDVVIGPVNDDGTIPRGSTRGWTPETVDEWNANRPGRGARTDLDKS
ncbi:helix-turn-helix transcriptional regulator [Rhodococcus sp. IEGM 1409]|uniref:helix-turn-helix domain-containing protein n=1 Tax=Rhodococcus sp. IEGM 1409 TaxID=3047082 RepID=UPI0024B75451|nr:helix-turn-helix transcriptional regulator [Rhodococcus sp. IEGM 1409]MDI9900522.1 helix-turn-helix transcriptional regulator [Rhodococcus sp. IEGM 1409]